MIAGEDKTLFSLTDFYMIKKEFELIRFNTPKSIESHLHDAKLLVINGDLSIIGGIELVEYLRDNGFDTPIIFIGENISTDNIEKVFSLGADDCLVKPFSCRELLCRIKAILKRTHGITQERLTYRDIIMDITTRKTYIDNIEVELTKLEFDLLSFFIQNKNTILKRDYILEKIWNGNITKKRTINVRISRLNNKIDPDNNKGYFTAIRGIGYRFG